MSSPLPQAPGEITATWLSEVLETDIAAVTLVDAHAGTTGRAVIDIVHSNDKLPNRLFVKLPPTDEMQRQFVVSTGMGRKEVLFYQHLSGEVPVRVPRAYFCEASNDGSQYILLLEHLEVSGCTFRNASTRYGREYIEEVLTAFAKLHGAYWESGRFAGDLGWLAPPVQHDIAVTLIEQVLARHGASMPPVFTQMAELYLAETDAIHRLWQRGADTVIHGDVHDANFFYDSDQPGLLDWAIVSRGPAMRDVGYFLAGTLSAQDQRDWGRELVVFYQEALSRHCANPASVDDLWLSYRHHAAYVWVGSAVTLAMGEEWQPVNYVKSGLQRVHTALEALESVEALRSAL